MCSLLTSEVDDVPSRQITQDGPRLNKTSKAILESFCSVANNNESV